MRPQLSVTLALGGLLVVEPGRAAFALRALLGLGGTPFALLRSPLVLLRGRCMCCLLVRRSPLMLLCDRPMFGRPLALLRGVVLTRAPLLLCRRRKLSGAFALTRRGVVLFASPDGMGLGFLAMSRRLAAKALALAATVLGRASGREQHEPQHDQDADHDGDHSDGGHVPVSTPSERFARGGPRHRPREALNECWTTPPAARKVALATLFAHRTRKLRLIAYTRSDRKHDLMALRPRERASKGAHTRRKMLAGILAAAAPSISAAPAVAGNFGPGKSDKGTHDPGALSHPPGQTDDFSPCR